MFLFLPNVDDEQALNTKLNTRANPVSIVCDCGVELDSVGGRYLTSDLDLRM